MNKRLFNSILLFSLLLVFGGRTYSQLNNNNEITYKDFYYQKKILQVNESEIITTCIYDSMYVYGFVAGYDSIHLTDYTLGGNFSNSDINTVARFLPVAQTDTIRATKDVMCNNFPQDAISPLMNDIGFILFGAKASGNICLFGIYYSELMNMCGIQFSPQTESICVFPISNNKQNRYSIIELLKNEKGYHIKKTKVNIPRQFAPVVLSDSNYETISKRNMNRITRYLTTLDDFDSQYIHNSSESPIMILLSERLYFSSLKHDQFDTSTEFAILLDRISK
jgi:hypothetical protein